MTAAVVVVAAVLGATSAPFEREIATAVEDVRAVWPVPPALVRAVIRQESAFDPRAKSKAGAIGLMQLMPANAAKLGLTEAELWEPAKNVLAGTRFLAVLLKHYDGDLISALVAYNAHPMKLGAPIPQNGETPAYVARVLRYYAQYSIGPHRWRPRDKGRRTGWGTSAGATNARATAYSSACPRPRVRAILPGRHETSSRFGPSGSPRTSERPVRGPTTR
jgi:hypothetical protein